MLEAQTLSNENRLHHKFSIIFEKSIYRIYGNFEYIIDHQSDYVKQRYIYIYIYIYIVYMDCALLYCELLDRLLSISATHRAISSLKTWKFPGK